MMALARENIASLTGLRFAAATMVFFSHYAIPGLGEIGLRLTKSGYAGVTVFFVLSGFVITYTYLERFEGGITAGGLGTYLAARFARVYPLYAAFILLGWAVQGGATPWLHLLTLQAWSGNVMLAFGVNSVAWSVGVEVFLYLTFPLLVPVLVKAGVLSSVRRLQVGALLVVLVMLCVALYFTLSGRNGLPADAPASAHRWLYRMPINRLGDFLLGIFGAVYCLRFARAAAAQAAQWSLATTLAAVVIPLFLLNQTLFASAFSWDVAYAVPAAVLIVGLTLNRDTVLSRVLGSPVCVLLGEASYALYLLHLPARPLLYGVGSGGVHELGLYVAFFGMLIALSIALHLAFERPARRWIRTWLSHGADASAATQPSSPAGVKIGATP